MRDSVPVYECHRRFVQVLQAGQPATWVFKSPMHLARLPALFAVYPDARIVRTHRDPAKTMPSSVSTLVHGRWTRSDHVDPRDIATSAVFGLSLMLNGIAAQLFVHEHINTTEAKAKAVRPLAEKMITFAKRGDVAARREVLKQIPDRDVVHKLFSEIGPRFAERNGGYTRILKLGQRPGDGAPMARIELVESE